MSALQDKMKHTIEIEGLPEGWEAVEYRSPLKMEKYFFDGEINEALENMAYEFLIVKKKQPRRIVLEETGEERSVSYGEWLEYEDGLISQWPDEKYGSNISYKVWREVKETDIPLTKEEPYLKLSVAECKSIYKWMDDVGINFNKITEFLKEN